MSKHLAQFASFLDAFAEPFEALRYLQYALTEKPLLAGTVKTMTAEIMFPPSGEIRHGSDDRWRAGSKSRRRR